MIQIIKVLIYASILLLAAQASAQSYTTETGHAEFLSKASLNDFTGTSDHLNGLIDLDKNLIDFYIDLNTLKTGIGLRDRHMRENYLETKKFPYAEFTGKIRNFEGPIVLEVGKAKQVTAVGTFKIHGVEAEREIQGTIKKTDSGVIELKTEFKVLLSDHDIDIPKVLFYELAEEQIVTIMANLKNQ